MYAHAGSIAAFPFFHLGSLDIGIPIQSFGVIVAAGVLIGAALLRRYAEWHGVSDEHIRGILGWITICGFLGAHVFDVVFYPEAGRVDPPMAMWPPSHWPHILRIWDGISSFGGFVGGAAGFAIYVWWKRRPVRLFADVAIVGLLPAFSIGRIGCTVVSDHVGAVVDKANWYAFMAMNYPVTFRNQVVTDEISRIDEYGKHIHANLFTGPENHQLVKDATITMWNLGLIEFLYLIPVNAIVLWLAFRPSKRMPAGFLAVLTGILYAPVRFFLDYLRPEDTDARHMGLTFAQWCALIAFGVCVYVGSRILKGGTAAETVARTSGEAQQRLKLLLKEDEERAEREREEAEAMKQAKNKSAAKGKRAADDDDDDDDEAEVEADKKADKAKAADNKADKAKKADKKADDKAEKAKADDKAEKAKADDKKADDKKADDKAEKAKADDKKTDDKKADDKKADKKVEAKAEKAKADDKKADDKKADDEKTDDKAEKAKADKADDK